MASSMASGSSTKQFQSPINIGVIYDMKVTSVTTASSFAVHLQDRMDTILHIQELAKKHGDSSPQLKGLQIGSLCLAKFDADSLWYRAVIRDIDVDSDVATVYFVDFGNVDECSIGTDLKECPKEISKILPQIVECQWMYANPEGTGMREVIDKLEELAEDELFIKAKVVDIQSTSNDMFLNYGDSDGPVVVDLPILEPILKKLSAPVLKDRGAAPKGDTVKLEPTTVKLEPTDNNLAINKPYSGIGIIGNIGAGLVGETIIIEDDDDDDSPLQYKTAGAKILPRATRATSVPEVLEVTERELQLLKVLKINKAKVVDEQEQVDNGVVVPTSRSIGDGDQLDAAIQIPGSSKGSDVSRIVSFSLGHDETTTKLMVISSPMPQSATVDQNTQLCSTECVKTLDEIAIQIDLMKRQISKMAEKAAAAAATPKTRKMTPEEHAARMKELTLTLNRKDRMVDCLLEMLTEKDNAIKMATRRNDEAREKYRIILEEKDEKLAALRDMARKEFADSVNANM